MKTKLRKRHYYQSELPSMTQQNFANECNVNSIMEKYRKTGSVSHIRTQSGSYGDFSQYQDFKQNLDTVRNAMDSFDSLPAHIRKKFSNSPENLVDFLSNPENNKEAVSLGLMVARMPENSQPKNDDSNDENGSQKTQA